jgi:hypothetical protein
MLLCALKSIFYEERVLHLFSSLMVIPLHVMVIPLQTYLNAVNGSVADTHEVGYVMALGVQCGRLGLEK